MLRHQAALYRHLLDHAQRYFRPDDLGEAKYRIRIGEATEPAHADAVAVVVELLDNAASAREQRAQELLTSLVQAPSKRTTNAKWHVAKAPPDTAVVPNHGKHPSKTKGGI